MHFFKCKQIQCADPVSAANSAVPCAVDRRDVLGLTYRLLMGFFCYSLHDKRKDEDSHIFRPHRSEHLLARQRCGCHENVQWRALGAGLRFLLENWTPSFDTDFRMHKIATLVLEPSGLINFCRTCFCLHRDASYKFHRHIWVGNCGMRTNTPYLFLFRYCASFALCCFSSWRVI